MKYNEQIGLVTGASSGIGKAIAMALSTLGMKLGLVGRDAPRLEAVCANARTHSARVEAYKADLCCDDDILRIAASMQEDFGAADILVHCAGLFRMGEVSHSLLTDLDLLYRANVRAPYALTQALLPIIQSRQGQIVFINSSAGLTARAEVSAYSASKHALKAVADSLRAEVNVYGVRVISIYPGRTATPLQEKIHRLEGKTYEADRLVQPEDVAKAVLDVLEMPRTAEVTDISIRPMQKA
jgi:NADP-dependent 3-hydroxy acid dehydrogenase YdfG